MIEEFGDKIRPRLRELWNTSKEEYDLFLEGKQKKQNIADFKSNILRSIQNDNFFRSINSDDLLKLNTLIEELKIKNKVS